MFHVKHAPFLGSIIRLCFRTLIEGEIRGTRRIMRKNPYQTRFRREFYRIIGGGELKNRQTPPSFQRLGYRICGKVGYTGNPGSKNLDG